MEKIKNKESVLNLIKVMESYKEKHKGHDIEILYGNGKGTLTHFGITKDDEWYMFSQGQGWKDQARSYYSKEEIQKIIWKQRKHINRSDISFEYFA